MLVIKWIKFDIKKKDPIAKWVTATYKYEILKLALSM